MAKIKQILKALIPPIVFSVIIKLRKTKPSTDGWYGEYDTWDEAKIFCTGYDSRIILEKCKNSLLKVKNGEVAYERDSVLFNEIQYSWGLLAGLQRAALENESNLCVLDFGGSLGSTYFQNKEFLSSIKNLKWCIVEQEHFVDCGKQYFEDEQLKFYHTIEECIAHQKPNVLLLSSVLQYLEKPYEWIERFINLEIPYIITDRTAFVEKENNIITIQKVPENIYTASYPAWFFGYNLMKIFQKKYKVISDFDNGFTSSTIINNKDKVYWKGLILKK
jgi:putative methyltransferase (TIGR04325 family)